MPVSKENPTTSAPELATPEPSPPELPEQQVFHQYLRLLTRAPAGTVIEAVMREELEALIGAAWGESTPKRKGYRNGIYTRNLVTSSGWLEDIKVRRRSGRAIPHPGVLPV